MIAAAFTMAHAYQIGWALLIILGAICAGGGISADRRADLHDAAAKPYHYDRSTEGRSVVRYHNLEADRLDGLAFWWWLAAGGFWTVAIVTVAVWWLS